MSGLKVLESVLGSLSEVDSFRVRTFREIVSSPGGSRVRNVFYAGGVLGVQEFEYSRAESLIGEKIDDETREPIYGSSDTAVHLYRVSRRLRGVNSSARPVVFKTSCLGEKQGIFEVHPSFGSVCESYDFKFTEGLKPSVKYSIVTPAVKIEFPVCGSVRGSPVSAGRSTDETAIISEPFSITPNSEMKDILEFFNSELTPSDYLNYAGDVFEQAIRVIHAVRDNSDFDELTKGYVQLDSEMEELRRKEDLMVIR